MLVPANCTDQLQPLNVAVNKPVKEFLRAQFHNWYSRQVCILRAQFHDWYSHQICSQLDCGTDKIQPVDLRLAIVKLHLWITYNYIQSLLSTVFVKWDWCGRPTARATHRGGNWEIFPWVPA